MPTYRSITTSVISQHGIFSLPEYPPQTMPNDPFSTLPTLCDQDRALVSVYIPAYPSSQFWIRYSIAPPYPPKALYYFKLFLKGTCIVSWGCGEEDGYEGRTMFGLYDSGDYWMGEIGIERRVLCFGRGAKPGENVAVDPKDVMEIKIYRAKGRMRAKPQVDGFQALIGGVENRKGPKPNTIGSNSSVNIVESLVSAGFLTGNDPQRFYKYALLDPLDKPFATFHYHIRTWRQLAAMDVIPSKGTSSVPKSHQPIERPSSPVGSYETASSVQTASSSSSSSNTHEHIIVPPSTKSSTSPPKWAIFAPKLTRSPSADSPPKKEAKNERPEVKKWTFQRAITAPSLVSLSPPHNATVTQARFASLVRRARTPSPPKQGHPSSIPMPSPRKIISSKRTPTPSPPKRTATRIPTPSPTKQDRVLGRSWTPLAERTPQIAAGGPALRTYRSGSMGLLMNVVNSAMNRRRRVVIDDAVENSESECTAPPPESSRVQVDILPEVDDRHMSKDRDDTSSVSNESATDEAQLREILEELPLELGEAGNAQGKSDSIKTNEDSASEHSDNKSKDHGTRSLSDTSSTRRRRWAIWGGLRAKKAKESGSDTAAADNEGLPDTTTKGLSHDKTSEPRD